ncbi:MAG: anaerobic ribonucleoside-triphosphate reductase [Bdellovibrionota bacterium]
MFAGNNLAGNSAVETNFALRNDFDGFKKRNGMIVKFDISKIKNAVLKAFEEVQYKNQINFSKDAPEVIAMKVLEELNNENGIYYVHENENKKRIPRIEDVQDLVEVVLAKEGYLEVLTSYKTYRKQREIARNRIKVLKDSSSQDIDVTDATLLLVDSHSSNITRPWDRKRLVNQLIEETNVGSEVANSIAKAVENQIITAKFSSVSSSLIRELVNNELAMRGYHDQLRDLSSYALSKKFIEQLIFNKSVENSNVGSNNPEAVNLGIAELVLKQWALDSMFSPEVKRAHDTGAIHLHDLGYPHRVYCSSHSIEYIKKYGLKGLLNLHTESSPAKSASVLTGHLNTFLASMQANYAGALGIAYINILYAPLLEGRDKKYYKQTAQELVFNGSQNAFSRGGQTLFLDFNVHTGIPEYMKKVPAIGAGGKYMLMLSDGAKVFLKEELREDKDAGGNRLMDLYYEDETGERRLVLRELADQQKGMIYDETVIEELKKRGEKIVTYGDYEKEAKEFAFALLEVFGEGDSNGKIFEFPKCDFHVSEETFTDPEQYEVFLYACEIASKNGSVYFIFDRDAVTLSACCRLRTTITDNRMLFHPESMRFCGFQNITINIPQAAYRAAKKGEATLEGLYKEVDAMMELCAKAHLEKKMKIKDMMSEQGGPLYQVGKLACDGKPYIELDKCTYIIGIIGVNDAVKFLTGKELHESDEAMDFGLKLLAKMYLKSKELGERHNLKFSIEETPAESASRRLAMTDLVYFNKEAKSTVKGDCEDVAYYTNSIHIAPEAPVSLVERIRKQSMYHSMIESGAIIHAFVGEEKPSPEAIRKLIKDTFFKTQAAQLTISPEFTDCLDCHKMTRGLNEKCPKCGSTNVVGETRVVGYFSKIQNWNKSKRFGELIDRQRGSYSIEKADDVVLRDDIDCSSCKGEEISSSAFLQ